jgi:hypothetical protein
VRSRRCLRAARPSLRVGRSRHPVTVCPDGWSPPRYLVTRNRIRLTGQLARPVLLTCAFIINALVSSAGRPQQFRGPSRSPPASGRLSPATGGRWEDLGLSDLDEFEYDTGE